MGTHSRALVLSGGGNAGMAQMAGIISGLREQGAGLGDADLIVGTLRWLRRRRSARHRVLGQAVDRYRRPGVPAVTVYAALPQVLAASMRIIARSPDGRAAARRIAAMAPLGERLASGAGRRRVIAAGFPVRDRPSRLLIAAVDAMSGRRVAFGADSGAGLADAVMASRALPGIYRWSPSADGGTPTAGRTGCTARGSGGRPRHRDGAQPGTVQRLPAGQARRRKLQPSARPPRMS